MSPLRIAIQPDTIDASEAHHAFSTRWIERLRAEGHEAVPVDVVSPGCIEQIRSCDGFMWWFPPVAFPRDAAKRLLLALDHAGLPVFPGRNTIWHFDDKISEAYLLQAAGLPSPRTWVFWRYRDAAAFCRTATYPIVLKLSTGYCSRNVVLLRSARKAQSWLRRMFTTGVRGLTRPPVPIAGRVRDVVRTLLRRPAGVAVAPPERGYFLLQEFVAGNDFDTRVTVIGSRLFAFRRYNRPNDFRASGSGLIDYDPAAIDPSALTLALRVARTLGTQSLCVDVLRRGEELVPSEISYFYEGWKVAACPGHWEAGSAEGELQWIDGSMRPEDAILEDFLLLVEAQRTGTATTS